jgi:hypothetical protein
MSDEKTQIAIRLADDLLARVDLYRAQVIKDLPGHDFTRADAIRVLIERGLTQSGLGAVGAPPAAKKPRRKA